MEKYVNRISSFCDKYEDSLGVEGIAIMDDNCDVIFERRWREDYPRDIYSNTKSFVGAAVGMAIFEGKINLESKVVDFFNGPKRGKKDYWDQLMLCDLLTMQSGFSEQHLMYFDRRKGVGSKDYIQYMMNQEMLFKPGTHFLYSSGDAILAGCMVETAVGKNLLNYLYNKFFYEVGIDYPIWESDLRGHCCGAAGLLLKLTDMMKLGCLYLGNGSVKGKRFFAKEWSEQSFKSYVNINENFFSEGYGYLWKICGHGRIFRASGVFGQETLVIPDDKIVVGFQCREGTDTKLLLQRMREEIFY